MKSLSFLLAMAPGLYFQFGAGTHGSIKRYTFNADKATLERSVRTVLANGGAVWQDSAKNYYNDDSNYVTISVRQPEGVYRYVFRYYGSRSDWDTSKTSQIFIAYAYNYKREGGSDGGGGIKWYHFRLRKQLTGVFEREFVRKIGDKISLLE